MARPSLPPAVAGVEKGPSGEQIAVKVDGYILRKIVPLTDPHWVVSCSVLAQLSNRLAQNEIFAVTLDEWGEAGISGPLDEFWSLPLGCRTICLVSKETEPSWIAWNLKLRGYR